MGCIRMPLQSNQRNSRSAGVEEASHGASPPHTPLPDTRQRRSLSFRGLPGDRQRLRPINWPSRSASAPAFWKCPTLRRHLRRWVGSRLRQRERRRLRNGPASTLHCKVAAGPSTGGALVDGTIVAVAAALFGFIFWKVAAVRPPLDANGGTSRRNPCLFWVVYQYLLVVYAGSTPGLRIAGLELARFDGSATTGSMRRWRVLASYLSAASLGMGYAWLFLDEDSLCWHDRITHTYLAPRGVDSHIEFLGRLRMAVSPSYHTGGPCWYAIVLCAFILAFFPSWCRLALGRSEPEAGCRAARGTERTCSRSNTKPISATFRSAPQPSATIATTTGSMNILSKAICGARTTDKAFLRACRPFRPLDFTEQDQLSHELLIRASRAAHAPTTSSRNTRCRSATQSGTHTSLADLPLAVPLDSVKHYEDYIARLHQIPRALSQDTEVLRAG